MKKVKYEYRVIYWNDCDCTFYAGNVTDAWCSAILEASQRGWNTSVKYITQVNEDGTQFTMKNFDLKFEFSK